MSKEIYQAVLLEIERYARRKSKQPADLFNDKGDAGRWITIGSEDDGEGGKHGGHPVFVGKDGEMKTGHFAGKTMKEAFGKNETKDQPKPGIIEGSTKVANEDAQGGDQLGLFGEGEKAKKKGWKPSLDDDTKGHQQSLFDTSGDKDQLMMFDDGVTPEDRIGKVDHSEASQKTDSGIKVEHVGGEDDGKKTELPFPSFAKDTQREQEESKPSEPKSKPTEQPAKDSKHDMSTLRGYTEFMKAVDKGEVSAEQLKAAHASFGENREALRDELNKMKKDDIVGWHHENDDGIQAFSYGADRKKKAALIEDKLGELESEFNKSSDSLSYNPFDGGSLADARRKAIGETTDEHLKAHAEKHAKAVEDRKQKREAFKDSLENPKTAHDWARKSRMAGGYSKLSQEEKAGYDDAMAAYRREKDPSNPQKPTEVKGFQPGQEATGDVGIVEGHHKKRDKPTWTVTVEQHLGDNWKDALSKAKSMGGNYVNARIARAYGATPGFQFFDKEAAENFKKVLGGESHDISDKVNSDAEARRQRQADSLLERAERIESRGEEKLNAPRKDNTARRARIARGMEDDARSEIAKAKTLRALAEHIEEGKSKNLNGVKAARHVEELDSMMHRAKSEAITAERKAKGNNWGYDAQERRYDSPAKPEDIEHAKFPYPQIWKMDMDNARTIMERTPGLKQLARKVGKWKKESLGQDFKQITDSKDIEAVQKALPKMRRHRDPQVRRLAEQLGNKFESYNRLHQMDIKSTPELRAALREYHALKQNPAGRDPIKEKLRDLKRDKTPGFFPTPSALSQRVVELAQIGEGHSVLEPSAGVGNLMDAVKDNHPDADMHGIEQKFDFADVLEMKGHKHEVGDFLKHDKQYDRIVMNPPFENRQDEKHVQHAYSLLKPGGRMVAITGSGAHTNERSAKFRDWLSEVGGKVIDLEAGQFMADDALKQTGVNTKLVVIEKPQESNKYSLRWEPTLTSERYSMSKWQPSLIGA